MNVVKSKYPTLLRSDTLYRALFNKFNLPEEHEVDMDPIVKAWKDDKRVMGVHKGKEGSLGRVRRLSCLRGQSRGPKPLSARTSRL